MRGRIVVLVFVGVLNCLGAWADKTTLSPATTAESKVASVDEDWNDSERQRTVPVRIVEPREISSPRPIVIVSHGLGGSRAGLAYFGRSLAADGYVVVHVQHVGSDDSVWRGKGPQEAIAALKAAASVEQFEARVADVHFVINELQRRNEKADWPLHGKLDLSRLAMAGHSFGAITTQAVCGQMLPTGDSVVDARIKAGIALSPSPPSLGDAAMAFGAIHVPMLFITGTKDVAPAFASHVTAEQRRIPFDDCTGANRYLLILDGADHMAFNGPTRLNPIDPQRGEQWLETTGKVSAAFLDATLLGDAGKQKYLDDGGFAREIKSLGVFEHRAVGK
jgi:predicted dienelactone hydrolase